MFSFFFGLEIANVMQSDEKKSVGFLNCKVLPEKKSSQSYERQNVVPCEFLKE